MRKTIVLYYLIVKPIPGGLISELLPFWCHIAHNCLTAPAQMLELQMMVPTTSSTGLARRQLTFIVRLSACIAVIAVLIALVPAGQSWVIKQESTNIWTGHMLAGTGGYHMALGGDRWQISDHTAVTTWLGTWP